MDEQTEYDEYEYYTSDNSQQQQKQQQQQQQSPSSSFCGTTIVRVDDILWTGLTLWKIPFHTVGNPQRRILHIKKANCHKKKNKKSSSSNSKTTKGVTKVQVLKSPTRAQMESVANPLTLELSDATTKKSVSKQIGVQEMIEIKEGQNTHAFKAFKTRHGKSAVPLSNLCFSIICAERTFDFYTEAPSLTTMIIEALRRLLNQLTSSLPSSSLKAFTIAKLRNKMDPTLNESHFFIAAKSGDVKAFLWYLEHGISIDTMENDERRDTALIAACRLGREDIVEIALQFDAKNDPHPQFGQTALQVAVASGHVDCARFILNTASQSGADRTIVNHEDFNKEAPIHVASRCGNIDVLELLIDHGANLTLVDAKGRSCLHCATQSGYHACLNFLLQIGCSSMLEQRDDQGYTCLHAAVKGNKIECAHILLEHGAAVDTMTLDGKNAILLAEKQKSEKMIQTLLQFQPDVRLPPPVDSVSFDYIGNNNNNSHDNMFQGLSLYNISGGIRTPQRQQYHSNGAKFSEYDDQYHFESSWSDNQIVENQLINSNGWSNNEYSEHDSFQLNNMLWFICISSGNYYYLRDFDNHSQVRFLCSLQSSSHSFTKVSPFLVGWIVVRSPRIWYCRCRCRCRCRL
jgi:ankyrin repeat protein